MVNQRRPRRPGGRRFFPRRKVCQFCVDKVTISYKDVPRLRRFISDWGKIESRRKTGTCAPHQRQLSLAIKRARYLAFLPYTGGHSLMELGRFEPRRDDRRRDRFAPEGRPDSRDARPDGRSEAPRPAAPTAEAAPEAPAAVEQPSEAGVAASAPESGE